jgi:hypothetical protein
MASRAASSSFSASSLPFTFERLGPATTAKSNCGDTDLRQRLSVASDGPGVGSPWPVAGPGCAMRISRKSKRLAYAAIAPRRCRAPMCQREVMESGGP